MFMEGARGGGYLLFDVLVILMKVFSVWFFLTALLFWKKPRRFPRRDPENRFCLLIPARNEEAVIERIVRSLQDQNYPRELYDIYVLANNCTDATELRARRAGARVMTMTGTRYKGDVLERAIDQLLLKDYDAFCVFDADNLVEGEFLGRMNDALLAGARVAKAELKTANPYGSWVSGCYGIYFGIFDRFFNRSRCNLGMSAKLVGTGFTVHRNVLEYMGGWHTETIAEDAEFSACLAEMGERVHWVPGAVTYDEAPLSFRVSLIQRRRWISGIMSVGRLKLGDIMKSLRNQFITWLGVQAGVLQPVEAGAWAKRGRTLRKIDSIMFLCLPFAQAFSVIPLLVVTVEAFIYGKLPEMAILLGIWYVGLAVFGLAVALTSGYRSPAVIKSVLGFPIFMASWVPVQTLSLLKPVSGWKPISHGDSVLPGSMAYRGMR